MNAEPGPGLKATHSPGPGPSTWQRPRPGIPLAGARPSPPPQCPFPIPLNEALCCGKTHNLFCFWIVANAVICHCFSLFERSHPQPL